MTEQDKLEVAWAKIQLNSCYGFPPTQHEFFVFDEIKSTEICKEAKKVLGLLVNKTSVENGK